MSENRERLSQWFTPVWLAAALVEQKFPGLGSQDLVFDPTCGDGSFLRAVPAGVPALGCEIDPGVAAVAREVSGRPVVVGDFRTVSLPARPSAIVGNPPFKLGVVNGILQRCFELLPWGGAAGFILPAYMLNNPDRVSQLAARWTIEAELLPRNVFGRLMYPLTFTMFRKQEQRTMVGFLLFNEARDVEQMPEEYREILRRGRGSVWRDVAVKAFAQVQRQGVAHLPDIYAAVEPKRPTGNAHWKDKIRQVVQQHFVNAGRGRWALAPTPTLGLVAVDVDAFHTLI